MHLQHGTEAAAQLEALSEAGKRAARLLPSGHPGASAASQQQQQGGGDQIAAGGSPLSPTAAAVHASPAVPPPASVIAPPQPKVPASGQAADAGAQSSGQQQQQQGTGHDPAGSAAQGGVQPASQLVPLLAVLVRDIAEPPAALATLERLLLGLGPGGSEKQGGGPACLLTGVRYLKHSASCL